MTVSEWLHKNTALLRASGIDSARLDCLLLLEDVLGQNRARLLAHDRQELSDKTEVELNNKITQRCRQTPLAYIRGKVEFYGRQFAVNQNVLVPRPETESIIELLKHISLPASPTIADIGTGSGCLAITTKLEIPQATVIGTDASAECLDIANQNALQLQADIMWLQGDLMQPLFRHKLSAVIANLPYVPSDYPVNAAARHEPILALHGGEDGMELYRIFWQQVAGLEQQPTHIITESLAYQHPAMDGLAQKSGYWLQKTSGLAQLFGRRGA